MRSCVVAVAVTFSLVVAVTPAAATPTAAFTYKPGEPRVGELVSLWAGASVCDARPCTYIWSEIGSDDKADYLGAGRSLVVKFDTEGRKTIQLRVTNRGFRAPPGPISDIARVPVNVRAAGFPTIDAGPVGTVNTADAKFEFASGSPGAAFECSLDGGRLAPCVSPVEYSGLSDGPHTFAVATVDGAEATRTWTVDTTAPKVGISAGPEGTTESREATIEFSADDAEADFLCRLDALELFACTPPVLLAGLAAGPHDFAVRAIDGAGNVSEETTRSWTVTVAPAPGAGEGAPGDAGAAGGLLAAGAGFPQTGPPAAERLALQLLTDRSVRLRAQGTFALRARATHAGTLAAVASVSARGAWALGLGRRSVQIGKGRAVLAEPGETTARVRLTARARTAVRRHDRPVPVTVAATLKSAAGSATQRIALRLTN